MLIPPKYRFNKNISLLLAKIEANRAVIDSLDLNPKIELNLLRESVLKSSLYSARIEGNPLTFDELSSHSEEEQKKIEIGNLLKAMNYVRGSVNSKITEEEILKLHALVVTGNKNKFVGYRNNMEGIFDASGNVVYLPPPPSLVKKLMAGFLSFVNAEGTDPVPVKAVLAHFAFEKIHPFLDGNGRVGRILMQRILLQGGYGMKGLGVVEEYLEKERSRYYLFLDSPEGDVTDFVEFMLEALAESSAVAKEKMQVMSKALPEDYLLPRRAEILRIIKDQKMINLDQLKRRFMKVNERTLRYDLKKLQEKKLIRKLGTTKGVYYCAV